MTYAQKFHSLPDASPQTPVSVASLDRLIQEREALNNRIAQAEAAVVKELLEDWTENELSENGFIS